MERHTITVLERELKELKFRLNSLRNSSENFKSFIKDTEKCISEVEEDLVILKSK